MKLLSIGLISAALVASVRASWLDKPSLVTYWGQVRNIHTYFFFLNSLFF